MIYKIAFCLLLIVAIKNTLLQMNSLEVYSPFPIFSRAPWKILRIEIEKIFLSSQKIFFYNGGREIAINTFIAMRMPFLLQGKLCKFFT